MEAPDYLTYKKNKTKLREEEKEKRKRDAARIKVLCIVFGLSFILCFLIIANIAGNFNARVDIEESRKGIEILDENSPIEQKGTIDKRLENIYNEEIGLSTARAVNKKDDEIIDPNVYKEMSAEVDEKLKIPDEPKGDKQENAREEAVVQPFTRVLVGRYQTVEEARTVQSAIKETKGFETSSPFIRKINDVYTIQVGSYTNADVAKDVAKKLDDEGYTVWVLEN